MKSVSIFLRLKQKMLFSSVGSVDVSQILTTFIVQCLHDRFLMICSLMLISYKTDALVYYGKVVAHCPAQPETECNITCPHSCIANISLLSLLTLITR